MSQQVQELIDKIKIEGVQAADQKAKEIEGGAQTNAQKVIARAKEQAEQIVADANLEAKRLHESTVMALKQSARDTILALRKEIENVLQKVIAKQVNDSLSSENLVNIIGEVIKKSVETNLVDKDIEVAVSAKDLEQLKNSFVAKLQKEVKQSIKLKSGDDMTKGFTISFDEGKSCFDFSDASLSEYLSSYLNAQVAALMREDV